MASGHARGRWHAPATALCSPMLGHFHTQRRRGRPHPHVGRRGHGRGLREARLRHLRAVRRLLRLLHGVRRHRLLLRLRLRRHALRLVPAPSAGLCKATIRPFSPLMTRQRSTDHRSCGASQRAPLRTCQPLLAKHRRMVTPHTAPVTGSATACLLMPQRTPSACQTRHHLKVGLAR